MEEWITLEESMVERIKKCYKNGFSIDTIRKNIGDGPNGVEVSLWQLKIIVGDGDARRARSSTKVE